MIYCEECLYAMKITSVILLCFLAGNYMFYKGEM